MIYDFTLIARRCGFDLSRSVTRSKLNQLVELVIRDVAESLPDETKQELYKRFNLNDPP